MLCLLGEHWYGMLGSIGGGVALSWWCDELSYRVMSKLCWFFCSVVNNCDVKVMVVFLDGMLVIS